MITYKRIRLKNVLYYKEVEFDLSATGLDLVLGDNGAGKSLLFTQIPELIFGRPPIGTKKDASRSGETFFSFEKNGAEYEVSFAFDKKGKETRTFSKNGKVLTDRGLDYIKEKIQAVVGRNEQEFYSLDFLDSHQLHPLIAGSNIDRRTFFTRVLRLNSVDGIKSLILKQLRDIDHKKSVLGTHRERIVELKDLLAKENRSELEEKIATLKDKNTKLLKKADEYARLKTAINFRKAHEPLFKLIAKEADNDLERFDAYLAALKNQLKSNKAKLEAAIAWTQWLTISRDYKKKAAEILGPIQAMFDKYGREELLAKSVRYEALQTKRDKLFAGVDGGIEAGGTEYIALKGKLEKTKHESDYYRKLIAKYEHEIEHSRRFKSGTCPTCGQDTKKLGLSPEDSKDKLVRAKDLLHKALKYEGWESLRPTYIEYKRLSAELTEVDEQLAKLKKFHAISEALRQLPTKPEAYEGKKYDEATIRKLIEMDVKRLNLAATFHNASEVIAAAIELEGREEEIESFSASEAAETTAGLSRLEVRLAHWTAAREEAIKVSKKIKALKEGIVDEEPLKLLLKASGNSGVKQLLIKRAASVLEGQVNKYTKAFFPEDYRFEFCLGTQFNILVHRHDGKKVVTSDVRRLSGAEKKFFALLLLIGLLSMLPKSRRSNVLILDEPTANMSPKMTDAFSRFLPVLNKVIPHIIILTPRLDEHYESARVWTVVKNKGVSTLCKGRP